MPEKLNLTALLNNKLYNQYYPLKTEESKNEFLNSNYINVYKTARSFLRFAKNGLWEKQDSYISKMKSATSIWGAPKYQNLIHNEYIIQQMITDRQIENIKMNITGLEPLVCKLAYHETKNITIAEANFILEAMNSNRRRSAMLLLAGLVLTCIYILMYDEVTINRHFERKERYYGSKCIYSN